MNPIISMPRQDSTASFGGVSTRRGHSVRMPRFFRRLFKFPQMDFEMAVWEMTNLLIAPKKVFRSMYYNKQTRNTWHRPDPSFTYLLSFFLLLTALAWSLAYADGVSRTLSVVVTFIFVHFLGISLLVATAMYLLVGRVLGPGRAGLPGRSRRQGLLGPSATNGLAAAGDQLEFGYCFDVSIRAFFPLWFWLYVVQFLLMPVISRDYFVSKFFGNTLYLVAFGYYFVITFLGYNVLWVISLVGFNLPKYLAPVLWAGVQLRKQV